MRITRNDPCAWKILHILLCGTGERVFLHMVISANARENQALMKKNAEIQEKRTMEVRGSGWSNGLGTGIQIGNFR
jgi:hypothetical protein